VLVVTLPNDYLAHAIRWALQSLGHECILIYPQDLSDRVTWSIASHHKVWRIEAKDEGKSESVDLDDVDSIWMRRVPDIYPVSGPDDIHDRISAETEIALLASGSLAATQVEAFSVNPLHASPAASNKILQFAIARQVGLDLPKTLVSNNLADITLFFNEMGRRIVYKPLRPILWHHTSNRPAFAQTTLIEGDLSIFDGVDASWSPGVFSGGDRQGC